jgi:lantibiotic biosynthesis protein
MLKTFSSLLFRSPLQPFNGTSKYSSNIKPIFQEGLYLSSPEFWQEFQKREQLNGKEKEKLELSFTKYWLRSSVRCTPYGTFAGSAMANISDQDSALILASNDTHRRSLRLDMNYWRRSSTRWCRCRLSGSRYFSSLIIVCILPLMLIGMPNIISRIIPVIIN